MKTSYACYSGWHSNCRRRTQCSCRCHTWGIGMNMLYVAIELLIIAVWAGVFYLVYRIVR